MASMTLPDTGALVASDDCPCLSARWTVSLPIDRALLGTSLEDYRDMLLDLLPPGEVWPRDPASLQGRLMEAFAAAMLVPVEAQAQVLLDEIDPRTTDQLLGRWEAWLGLPDDCLPAVIGLDARRQRVIAKRAAEAVVSKPDFVRLAALLGFDIEIEEPFPLGAGCLRAGRRAGCCCAWIVHVRCAETVPGISLQAAAAMLECLFERQKQAQMRVFFRYASSLCHPHADCIVAA